MKETERAWQNQVVELEQGWGEPGPGQGTREGESLQRMQGGPP